MSPHGIDIKLYLTIVSNSFWDKTNYKQRLVVTFLCEMKSIYVIFIQDQFNGSCPIDDDQYKYMEKIATHDTPPTITKDTLIDFTVPDVNFEWNLRSCRSCGVSQGFISALIIKFYLLAFA